MSSFYIIDSQHKSYVDIRLMIINESKGRFPICLRTPREFSYYQDAYYSKSSLVKEVEITTVVNNPVSENFALLNYFSDQVNILNFHSIYL